MTIQEAVDDIIARGVSELRKRAFGDDAEDAKNLAWTREQAWILMKQLAKKPEVGCSCHTELISCLTFCFPGFLPPSTGRFPVQRR